MKQSATRSGASIGLLGDTPERDYSSKLRDFNAFAEPELRTLIASLGLTAGTRVLDAGCGTGEALHWLAEAVGPGGTVLGIELAAPHVEEARRHLPARVQVLQADLLEIPLPSESLDFIWCVNTLHHLRAPLSGLRRMASWLRPGGRIAVGQSSLLPDMYFAWDARLERATNEAVREYYRQRYALEETDLASVRSLLGVMRAAPLQEVSIRTVLIERTTPLQAADRTYLLDSIFRRTWGERLRPYMTAQDHDQLSRWCDPGHVEFALRRADFHFLQTFTLAVGAVRE
jgi:SAM-dependent methyltransferase